MDDRKFTPPTEFPAEYVDGNGYKVLIYGRGHGEHPLIGQTEYEDAMQYREDGSCLGAPTLHLHDTPKRITTWHNVYGDWISPQRSTRSDADLGDHSEGYLAEERFCVYRIERDEDGGNFEIFVEDV